MGKFLHAFFSPLGFRHAVPQVRPVHAGGLAVVGEGDPLAALVGAARKDGLDALPSQLHDHRLVEKPSGLKPRRTFPVKLDAAAGADLPP